MPLFCPDKKTYKVQYSEKENVNMKIAAVIAALSVAVTAFDGPAPMDHGMRLDTRDEEKDFGRRAHANIPGLNFMEDREEQVAQV